MVFTGSNCYLTVFISVIHPPPSRNRLITNLIPPKIKIKEAAHPQAYLPRTTQPTPRLPFPSQIDFFGNPNHKREELFKHRFFIINLFQ